MAVAAAVVSVMLYVVFTPSRITPVVLQYANEYLQAEVACESVELTFYSTFPDFGIRLLNGSVIARGEDRRPGQPQDTLLLFGELVVSFNPLTLYRERRLVVNRAQVVKPIVHVHVDESGRVNWEGLLPVSDETPEVSDSSSIDRFSVDVKSIRIREGYVIYDNRQDSLFIAAERLGLHAKGSLTDVDVALGVGAATVLYGDKTYSAKLPLKLAAHVVSDTNYEQFRFEKTALSIGVVDFDIQGAVARDSVEGRMKVGVDFGLHASSLADLLTMIPDHVLDIKRLTASGAVDFSGKIEGCIGAEAWPRCTVSLRLNEGTVAGRKYPDKPFIERVDIDCAAVIDLMQELPSSVDVRNLYLQTPSAKLSVSGVFGDLFRHPFINACVHGNVDFDRFWQHIPFEKTFSVGGSALLDVSGHCYLNDLLVSDYGKINATGEVAIRQVMVDYPQAGLSVFAPSATVSLGSHVVDSIRGREIASLFRANVDMDSLNLQWGHTNRLHAGHFRATFRTSAPADSVSVAEMSAFARLSHMQLQGDSMRVRASRITAIGRLSPLAGKPSQPEWSIRLSMDSVRSRLPDFSGRVENTRLSVRIQPHEMRSRLGSMRQTEADSIRRKLFRDSLERANRNTSAVAFKLSEGETRDFLSRWDVSGSFTGTNMRVRTPYFPLRTRVSDAAVTFTSDRLQISRARVQTGGSDIVLDGEIEGLRRALLRNGRITARMRVGADSINFNEIIRALATGSEYSEKSDEHRDSIAQVVLNESSELPAPADSLTGLFVVPRNVDMAFEADLKNVTYGKLHLRRAAGNIVMRNQSVRIPDLRVSSDIGNVDLSMVYKAPTTKGAYTGMDIYMQRVHVRELIGSIPMLDSLTPMLHSFDGEVEYRITAVTELDSLSNVVIPKTTASCYINGRNMVLLDGETFSSIAKKLYFKNKSRNIIDSIAVELVLEDSKIMVFPFVVSIDRYQAAIGGTQNLDMSFQYHISILKWPIPLIKLGLNLWGTPDNIHYGLASRKYANLKAPVKEQSLESTVINMREQLYASLRKSIDDILNESAENLHRPRVAMNVQEREALFGMDTVSVKNQE
jgi:hypothetical protein